MYGSYMNRFWVQKTLRPISQNSAKSLLVEIKAKKKKKHIPKAKAAYIGLYAYWNRFLEASSES